MTKMLMEFMDFQCWQEGFRGNFLTNVRISVPIAFIVQEDHHVSLENVSSEGFVFLGEEGLS